MYILATLAIAVLITFARCTTDGVGGLLYKSRGNIPNTSKVSTIPLGPAILFTTLTAICKRSSFVVD